MADPVNVGVIGCGNISDRYLSNLPTFKIINLVACADIDYARAKVQAAKYNIRALTVTELLDDPEIEIVVDLTIPLAHAQVNLAALRAGKNVQSEKPLAVTRADGKKTLSLAHRKKLRVGAAPDTFLGGSLQTSRYLIDGGAIGEPVAATAFMITHGPEGWHPNPDFFYQPGAGPLFDVGPYYLTALIHLLGPMRRVTASTRASFSERIAADGHRITVNTPTHVTGALEFVGGPIASLVTSFDIWHSSLPRIEIYGTEGTLIVPDPNHFGGDLRLRRAQDKEWREIPLTYGYVTNLRGIGVADMARAMRAGDAHRCSGEMAYHVLDTMHALLESAERGRHIDLKSTCERPAILPLALSVDVEQI